VRVSISAQTCLIFAWFGASLAETPTALAVADDEPAAGEVTSTSDTNILSPGPEPSALVPGSEKMIGRSSTQRVGKDWYAAVRLPAITLLGSTTAGEVGAEGGAFLGPNVLVLAQAQTGYLGHSDVSSGQIYHVGALARVFLGNAFFVSGGLELRRVSLNLKAAHTQIPAESATNLARPYLTYGQSVAATIGLPLGLGWQWQAHSFALGFEAVNVFVPVGAEHTHGSFNAAYPYPDHDRGEPGRKAKSLSHTADLSLGRLMVGAAF
jgi:hypothetical protein